jgi:hypothetical protein
MCATVRTAAYQSELEAFTADGPDQVSFSFSGLSGFQDFRLSVMSYSVSHIYYCTVPHLLPCVCQFRSVLTDYEALFRNKIKICISQDYKIGKLKVVAATNIYLM